eukprot:COSAG02_NODE_26652_length_628_cov_0.933837_1_plen_68_part_01
MPKQWDDPVQTQRTVADIGHKALCVSTWYVYSVYFQKFSRSQNESQFEPISTTQCIAWCIVILMGLMV